MAFDAGAVTGEIVLRYDKAIGALKIVEKGTESTMARMSAAAYRMVTSLEERVETFGNTVSRMGRMVALPLAAVATGLYKLGISTANYSEQLRNQSAMSGLTIQQLQEYRFICEQNQISTEALTNASAFLQRSLMGIEEGTGNAAKVMTSLGISVHEADGSLRPMSELMPQVVTALSAMTNETQRGTYAAQIFGRGWKEMAPLLALGTAEIERMKQAAHDLGIVWSPEMYEAAKRVDAQMDLLKARLQGLSVTVAAELLPTMESLLERLGDVVKATSDWAKEQPKVVKGLIDITLKVGGLSAVLMPFLLALPGTIYAMRELGLFAWLTSIGFAFKAVAGGAATAGEAFAFLASKAGPIGLLIAEFIALGAILNTIIRDLRSISELRRGVGAVVLSERIQAGADLRAAKADLARLKQGGAYETFEGFKIAIDPGWITIQAARVAELQKRYDDLTAAYKKANTAAASIVPTLAPVVRAQKAAATQVKELTEAELEDTAAIHIWMDWLKSLGIEGVGNIHKLIDEIDAMIQRAPGTAIAAVSEGVVGAYNAMTAAARAFADEIKPMEFERAPHVMPTLETTDITLIRERLAELYEEWKYASDERRLVIEAEMTAITDKLAELKPAYKAATNEITLIWQNALQGIQSAWSSAIYNMMTGMAGFGEFLKSTWEAILQSISALIAAHVAKWIAQITGLAKALEQLAKSGGGGGGGTSYGAALGFAVGGPVGAVIGGFLPFQHGGIVTKPTLAMLGERGPEAVVPLGHSPLSAGQFPMAALAGGGGGVVVMQNLSVDSLDELSLRRLARRSIRAVGHELWRARLRTQGGVG